MNFTIIGEIVEIESIAIRNKIRELKKLTKVYGKGRWRKLKGIATIRLDHGKIKEAELHWYEAHGKGKQKIKIKRFLD